MTSSVPDRILPIGELEALYRSRYHSFVRVALGMLGDRDQARDAVQEAFARAIRNLELYRGDASLETWLWSILVNICRAERRRVPRLPVENASEAQQNGDYGGDAQLRAAVAALPARQRLIVFLRHYADLEYDAIAEAVGVRRGTVAATLTAAHESLRRALVEAAHE
jgi:RNA polymerase sigma-70 factor, ECF subfamily